MNWDVFVMKFAEPYERVSDIPSDAVVLPLGSLPEVRSAIDAVFEGVDWTEPDWGDWNGAGGSIEFAVGKDDPVTDIALFVRADERVIPVILQLCRDQGWRPMEGSAGFLDRVEDPATGLKAWMDYVRRAAWSGS